MEAPKTQKENPGGSTALAAATGYVAKVAEAEERSAQWLADGNAAKEQGNLERAERCYDKSAFWLMRANRLRGW